MFKYLEHLRDTKIIKANIYQNSPKKGKEEKKEKKEKDLEKKRSFPLLYFFLLNFSFLFFLLSFFFFLCKFQLVSLQCCVHFSESHREHRSLGRSYLPTIVPAYLVCLPLTPYEMGGSRTAAILWGLASWFYITQLISLLCSWLQLEKLSFFSSNRSDFLLMHNLSITVHTFPVRMLTSLSVDEILLPKYMNWFLT